MYHLSKIYIYTQVCYVFCPLCFVDIQTRNNCRQSMELT